MKKLQKGFTLVELIVVMCLMGFIMGAVMAIVSPTTQFASKVVSTKDAENVCLQLGREMNNKLSYVQQAEVYGLNSGESFPSVSTDYDHVMMIDNVSHRSGSKKGATGRVQIAKWSSSGISDLKTLVGDNLYDEDSYEITIAECGSGTGMNNFIMFQVKAMPMKMEGGSYVKNTDQVYTFTQSIDFVNINNKDLLNEESNGGNALSFDESVYSKSDLILIFYKEPVGATASGGSGGSGGGGGTPTPTPTPAVTHMVTFSYNGSIWTTEVEEGTTIDEQPPVDEVYAADGNAHDPDFYAYEWRDVSGNKAENIVVTGPITLSLYWVDKWEIIYYNDDGSIFERDTIATFDPGTSATGYTFNIISEQPTGGSGMMFKNWRDDSGNTYDSDQEFVINEMTMTRPIKMYPNFVVKPCTHVIIHFVDGINSWESVQVWGNDSTGTNDAQASIFACGTLPLTKVYSPWNSYQFANGTSSGTTLDIEVYSTYFKFQVGNAAAKVGTSGEYWYYGSQLHDSAPSMIEVHFSSRLKTYPTGEQDNAVYLNGDLNNTILTNPGTAVIVLNAGSSVKIGIRGSWWSSKNEKTFTYAELQAAPGIWIMEGEIYLSQPAGWVD